MVAVAAPTLAVLISVPPASAGAQRVLTVVARDTGLVAAQTIPAGLTTVRLVLNGSARRDLVVRRVPAGTAPEVFVRGAAGRSERFFSQWSFGGPAAPRDSATDANATVDLRPGRYALVSYEMDAQGRPRADKYLWRVVNAVAATVLIPARFPRPDMTIKLRDTRVDVSGSVRPGQRTIQIENAGGRPHELLIGRLKAGMSVADVQRWKRDKGEPAPFVYAGGVTPLSSAVTTQTRLVLQTGLYVVYCTMRGERDRAADHERGVVATFKVN
jgi:hypothetical protein